MKMILSLVTSLVLPACLFACDYGCGMQIQVQQAYAVQVQQAVVYRQVQPVIVRETIQVERHEVVRDPVIVERRELVQEYTMPQQLPVQGYGYAAQRSAVAVGGYGYGSAAIGVRRSAVVVNPYGVGAIGVRRSAVVVGGGYGSAVINPLVNSPTVVQKTTVRGGGLFRRPVVRQTTVVNP